MALHLVPASGSDVCYLPITNTHLALEVPGDPPVYSTFGSTSALRIRELEGFQLFIASEVQPAVDKW